MIKYTNNNYTYNNWGRRKTCLTAQNFYPNNVNEVCYINYRIHEMYFVMLDKDIVSKIVLCNHGTKEKWMQ